MVDALTPIPQPSEIVAFLIRAMSHIGDEQELALKKELQRLRKGKPLSPSAANAMLKKHLGEFHAANGNTEWEATDFLPMLKGYTQLCLHLDCSALPTDVIRSVFDRVACGCFLELFKNLLPITGVAPNELLGKPDQATQLLWQSRIKDLGLKQIATEIESITGLHKGQENWEATIDRWLKGQHDARITTIFALMRNWDRKFARTLLAARLYRRYCELEMVDHHKHRPGYELPFDYSEIQTAIQELTQSLEYSSTCCLDKRCEDVVNELTWLTHPHRPKEAEDATSALGLIQMLETSLEGQPRLAGLGFFRGLYHAQMAQLPEALEAFDSAADWFQFRSARQLKNCLHHALNISSKLGKKRIFAKWEGLCEGLGLDIAFPDASLALARDFQNPFPEADPPPLKWSSAMFRKTEETHGQQATEAGRDCHEVKAG
ncbi:hypothetical protein [Shimia aestuarii]|uniref:hypothetical protein n=1 Tax=Shimia aestuarii TaxID=254406 RepID=UPI001FB48D4D|nr:hypothetical protein [Shimia aestuarii]